MVSPSTTTAASPPQPPPPPPAPPSAPPRAQPVPLYRTLAASPVGSRPRLQVTSWTLDTPLEAPPPALPRPAVGSVSRRRMECGSASMEYHATCSRYIAWLRHPGAVLTIVAPATFFLLRGALVDTPTWGGSAIRAPWRPGSSWNVESRVTERWEMHSPLASLLDHSRVRRKRPHRNSKRKAL
ncbi:hypothetical protein NDU88_006760 [Pleurodeles waltl]|uniref:Uncharacterized protein n=1 Tax=Pleurodeles waltl TaxID=8319 RepID=A0AAV7U0D5_PLEWA|nr:hypothetical protein NDU88_006760 [Pleurodeles waltl]